ncbi:MAG: DUF1232 domain-containing protein [Burkholderiales bacterium]|nr:MAG: DUF1232 domain-containing protein [Burkholderiales bacterium]
MAKVEPVIIDATPVRMDQGAPRAASSGNTAGGTGAQTPLASRSKWKRVAIGVLALLYVLSPLDLVPDWIPLVGWLDDIGILAWAARQVFFKRNS